MKRSIFVAALALTPALLHAQATVPAQTALQAHVIPVAAVKAATPKAANAKVRVSTGVVAPHLLTPITLTNNGSEQTHLSAENLTMVVTLTVDAAGKPSNIAIAQPTGAGIDQEVVAALNQAHFQPGTLDGEAFALPVRLSVVIERGTRY